MDELTKNGVSDDVVRAMAARTYGKPIPGYKAPPRTPLRDGFRCSRSSSRVIRRHGCIWRHNRPSSGDG